MVPKNKLKTYAGPNKSVVNTSVDVFNNLLAKNLSRRIVGVKKRRKNLIKELPQRVAHTLLADDSFHVSTEDTFDKLLKKTPENSVGRRTISKNSNKSLRSPVWTRSRSRSFSRSGSVFQTSNSSETHDAKSSSHSVSKRFQRTSHKALGSSVWTRSASRTASRIGDAFQTSDTSDRQNTKSSSNSVLKRFQQTTVDPVYESIEVEVEPFRTSVHSSLSYIKVPEFQFSKVNNVSADTTFPNSFLRSFKDHPMANSTPFMFDRRKNVSRKNARDASGKEELLQRSLQEIQSWDERVPDFTAPKVLHNSKRTSLDSLLDFQGFANSKSKISGRQQKRSLVVSLEEFNQFQSKNNFISNFENSSEIGYSHSLSQNEHNDFVTKRRRIARSVSAVEDSLLSKECLVIVEKCDQTQKNEQCRNVSESGNTPSGSFCSNVSDKEFEDFFAKNHQLIMENYEKDKRELVVNVTNCGLNDSVLITNTAISDVSKDSHDENHSFESSQSVIENSISENVDLNKELRINLVRHDFCNKDLVVNLTLNEFDISTLTDQSTQTDFEYGVKELFVNLTFNDYKVENEDTKGPNESIIDLSCENSMEEISGSRVNTGTSHDKSSEIIDLANSFQSVSKTDHRYSNGTNFRTTNDVHIEGSKNNTTIVDTTLTKIIEDDDKDNSVKSTKQLENTLKDCITPDMFNDSMHSIDTVLVVNENGLEELGNTLKESNLAKTPDKSMNLIESSLVDIPSPQQNVFKVPEPIKKKPVVLRSGKHWRRSLSVFKNTSIISEDALQDDCLSRASLDTVSSSDILPKTNRVSVRIVPLKSSVISRKTSVLKDYASFSGYVPTEAEQQRDSQLREENLENSFRSLSIREATLLHHHPVTAREIVLSRCQQTEPWKFSECYPDSVLQHCQKIGEGVYGEVYLFRNPKGGTSVMKIIPIEGSLIVNGERQKKYEEILSEIVISMELSNLRKNTVNSTSGFTELQEVKCIQGRYPERLLDLWHLYDETKGSENDCPDNFLDDQLYIVLQLADAGKDLESFVFANAQQAMAMFKQVAFALAVAEEELHFEHRDLHWGNILLKTVDKNTKVRFTLNGNVYIVPTKGVQATIIDFTLSRVEYDGVVIFNDLSLDPDLFTAEGDYQFDIYRLMQKENGNNWQNFVPYTNLLWLHYILDKSITLLRYKNPGRKLHKEYIIKLKELEEEVLNYRSVKDFVLQCLT